MFLRFTFINIVIFDMLVIQNNFAERLIGYVRSIVRMVKFNFMITSHLDHSISFNPN